jgi:predicted amidophosphoribosyltransferase
MNASRLSCISEEYPESNVTDHRNNADMLDLVLPLQCGGCGAPSTRWCGACARELAVKPDEPHLIAPRLDPGVPVFSLGRYAGARRETIVAVKEHGRADLIEPLAIALRAGLARLLYWGLIDTPLTLVAAPTRRWAARRRGGDPVTRMAQAAVAGRRGISVVAALRTRPFVADSVGLSSAARQRNITGRVRAVKPVAGEVVLVDDIITTGATACESVRVLHTVGAPVVAVLALANA